MKRKYLLRILNPGDTATVANIPRQTAIILLMNPVKFTENQNISSVQLLQTHKYRWGTHLGDGPPQCHKQKVPTNPEADFLSSKSSHK